MAQPNLQPFAPPAGLHPPVAPPRVVALPTIQPGPQTYLDLFRCLGSLVRSVRGFASAIQPRGSPAPSSQPVVGPRPTVLRSGPEGLHLFSGRTSQYSTFPDHPWLVLTSPFAPLGTAASLPLLRTYAQGTRFLSSRFQAMLSTSPLPKWSMQRTT